MHRLGIRQPWIELEDLLGLTSKVIQDVDVEVNRLVDGVPIIDDLVIVSAQADDHPARQVFERLEGLGYIAVGAFTICGDDDASALIRRTARRSGQREGSQGKGRRRGQGGMGGTKR